MMLGKFDILMSPDEEEEKRFSNESFNNIQNFDIKSRNLFKINLPKSIEGNRKRVDP